MPKTTLITHKRRTYTIDERASAVSCARAHGNNYRAASRHTGIPPTTIQQWCQKTHEVYAIPQRERNFVHEELLHRLDEKIDALLCAINPERIKEANLSAVSNSLCAILVRREQLTPVVTPEEMERRQQIVADIILRHVSDPAQREAIVNDFNQIGTQDSPA